MMLLQNKQIAIVGGGPGGLTLARLLQLQGATVKVYERDVNKDARVQGTTLDLHEGSGLKALREAGLLEEFKKNYRPGADRKIIVNGRAEIFFSGDDAKQEEDFGSSHFRPEIDRGPLRQMLLGSLRPNTVVWDSHFVSLQKQQDGWLLQCKNQPSAYADVVIGADGAGSKIRPYITPIKPFYVGITGLEGSVLSPETSVPNMHALMQGRKVLAFGGEKTFTANSKGDGSLGFYLTSKVGEEWAKNGGINFADTAQVLAWFKNAFAGWSGVWHELFENAETPLIPRPIYCMPLHQAWNAMPNLTMLGDAAHVMPPFSGEGVNMAMLDAVELCGCLCNGKHTGIQTAIAAYEKQMLQRFAAAAQEALQNGEWMHSPGALEKMLAFFGAK